MPKGVCGYITVYDFFSESFNLSRHIKAIVPSAFPSFKQVDAPFKCFLYLIENIFLKIGKPFLPAFAVSDLNGYDSIDRTIFNLNVQ